MSSRRRSEQKPRPLDTDDEAREAVVPGPPPPPHELAPAPHGEDPDRRPWCLTLLDCAIFLHTRDQQVTMVHVRVVPADTANARRLVAFLKAELPLHGPTAAVPNRDRRKSWDGVPRGYIAGTNVKRVLAGLGWLYDDGWWPTWLRADEAVGGHATAYGCYSPPWADDDQVCHWRVLHGGGL